MPFDESDEEEDMDGGALPAKAPVKKEPVKADSDEEEDMDGGSLPVKTAAAMDDESEEEELDGGELQADLFGPDNAEYAKASLVSEWLPPGRQAGRIAIAKRGAPVPPPPPRNGGPPPAKRPAHERPAQRGGLSFVSASASDAEHVASEHSNNGAVPMELAPPPMMQQPPPEPSGGGSGMGGGGSSIAERMMSKMGYKKGGGLGKNEEGVTAAIEERGNMGNLGVGFEKKGDGSGWQLPTTAPELGPEELDPCPVPMWMGKYDGPTIDQAMLDSWLVEGVRVESIDHETEHVKPPVLKAMLRAKTMLDDVQDRRAFNDARTRANPFEAIKKEFFLNRAALKMAAMDAAFGLLFSGADSENLEQFAKDSLSSAVAAFTESHSSSTCSVPRPAPSVLYFGDVAAGPGGFSEYLLWRRSGSSKGFGFTLRGEHDFTLDRFHHRAAPELFHAYYGPKNDGDLYNSDNIRALRALVRRQTNGTMLHVMMADGGFDVSGLENIQEVMNKQLLLSQFASALATLRVGGHFVCKCFDLFTPFSAGLLYLLHAAFDDVCIYKPAQSRPANSERYVVCKGMREGVEPITEHLLRVNTRLNELKDDWPCGGRVGAAGKGEGAEGTGYGPPGRDVLRLVPYELLQKGKFGAYLHESNTRLGALQAKALERLIIYMRTDRGGRVCDQAATRDECLRAWALPPEIPPPPPAHGNVELFYQIEIEKGDHLERKVLMSSGANLTADDLKVTSHESRLRTTGDWVVMEASCDGPPCLVVGADGDGRRGVACAYDVTHNIWRLLPGVKIPAATLLLAEVVWETRRDADLQGGNGKQEERQLECVHVIDAAMLCGDDCRRLPYAERYRRASMMVDGLMADMDAVVQTQVTSFAKPPVQEDVWAAVDRELGNKKEDPVKQEVEKEAKVAADEAVRRDYCRLRMKKQYGLHEIPDAVNAGRVRAEQPPPSAAGGNPDADAIWPCFGLLLFPGHANPQLPLEPANEWSKEWSASQQRDYWYNKRTKQSIWDSLRKTRPISFRSSMMAMIRWDRGPKGDLDEETVLEQAEEIAEPVGWADKVRS